MEEFVVKIIGFGVISWTSLFIIVRRVLQKRSFDFCTRLVSTTHAILAVVLATLSVHDWNCPVCPLASKSSPQQCGSEMVAALWITELSSPLLHLREILKELGYKDTGLNLAVDIMFALVFTAARMIGGPYLTYVTLSANNPFLIKAMALGLQLVSAFWFYKIVLMVRYKLSKWISSSRSRYKIHPQESKKMAKD